MWPGPSHTCMPSFILIRRTVWPQYTNVTDRQTDRQDRTDNGPIAYGEPFYKRSPKNRCVVRVMQLHCTRMFIITARRSNASAVLGVVILSVCPSVTRVLYCFVTNPKNLPVIFLYHILITANMQSKTGFPSSHQLKSYVTPLSLIHI